MGSRPKIQDVFYVELRMNPSQDEYEEVESPFASKSSDRKSSRDRLRSRKNVFNRPFSAEPTNSPTYIETTATRRTIGHANNADLIETRKSRLNDTHIEYLDEEDLEEEVLEEEIETRPARTRSTSPKKKLKNKKNILAKAGWILVAALTLRLFFMDRGVWDYFSTESAINDKKSELKSIQNENRDLKSEISRIQLDKNYQKQLAKEHLGVIAADEFLILFAGESSEEEKKNNSTI